MPHIAHFPPHTSPVEDVSNSRSDLGSHAQQQYQQQYQQQQQPVQLLPGSSLTSSPAIGHPSSGTRRLLLPQSSSSIPLSRRLASVPPPVHPPEPAPRPAQIFRKIKTDPYAASSSPPSSPTVQSGRGRTSGPPDKKRARTGHSPTSPTASGSSFREYRDVSSLSRPANWIGSAGSRQISPIDAFFPAFPHPDALRTPLSSARDHPPGQPLPAPSTRASFATLPLLPLLPLNVLSLIRDHLTFLTRGDDPTSLDYLLHHVSFSRTCRVIRTLYNGPFSTLGISLGGKTGAGEWWVEQMEMAGFGLPAPAPVTSVCALLLYMRHRAVCNTNVLRPWKWKFSETEMNFSTGKKVKVRIWDNRGEWVGSCAKENGVWPPRKEDILSSATVLSSSSSGIIPPLFPHPLLSDIHIPLSPPPLPAVEILSTATQTLQPAFTLLTDEDEAIPVGSHPSLAYQSATWPPSPTVEVHFKWKAPEAGQEETKGKGKKKAAAPEEWELGTARLRIDRRAGEGPVTVSDLLQAVAAFWGQPLSWDEVKRLRLARPELDDATENERKEKGSLNKRLGKIRRDYGRWGWLGPYTVLTGYSPSTSSAPNTLVARLTTQEKFDKLYSGEPATVSAPLPATASGSSARGESSREKESSISREDSGYAPSGSARTASDSTTGRDLVTP